MNAIFRIIAIPLGYLMNWCYILFADILSIPSLSFVFAMFLFTLITRALQFPLVINQQKSSAKMAAMNPLMQEVTKKFAADKQRQQAEMQKLQEEMGYNPMSGCLPMIIQFIVMFGIVEVIYSPLTYMLRLPAEFLEKAGELVTVTNQRMIETAIIEQAKNGSLDSLAGISSSFAENLNIVKTFNMSIGSIDLWNQPQITVLSLLWIMPLFSILTQVLTILVQNKISGVTQTTGNTGKIMTYSMVLVSAVFAFMWPAAFSLYWGMSGLIMVLQSLITKRIINPEKIKQDTLDAYYQKKNSSKNKKTVTVVDKATGKKQTKVVNGQNLAKIRIQKAREIDAKRYEDEEISNLMYPEYEGKRADETTDRPSLFSFITKKKKDDDRLDTR